jgi:acetyl esterase
MSPSDTPVLDPRTRWFLQFLKDSGRPQVFEVPLAEARAMFVKGQEAFAVPKLPAEVEDRAIPAGAGGELRIRIVRPVGDNTGLPVVMLFHGGGWVLGDADTYDAFARQIANGAGATVVHVEYSRSPEARYPVALEECYAATQWVVEHGQELGADATRLALTGDSAGGNLVAAVSLLAKQRSGPKIAAQVLIYPATGSSFETPSFQQFGEGYYLTAAASRWFWNQYAPDRSVDSEPTACPLHATIEQLQGLPPALIITAECDILRDEGEAYARNLTEAGVAVTCTRYLGTIHGFMGANALAETPAARAGIAQMNAMLRRALASTARGESA